MKTKNKLSPVQRRIRNSVIKFMFRQGLTVNDIAHIMSMTQSTVSRVTRDDSVRSVKIDSI